MGRNPGLARAGIATLSMLPGFLFPFVLAQSLDERQSDLFLLASSLALTLAGVVGSAIEVNTVVQVGRVLARGEPVARNQLEVYRRRQLAFSIAVSLALGLTLTAIYGFRSYREEMGLFISVAVVCVAVPIIGSAASIRSGELIARDRPTVPILLQSARSVPPLVVVVFYPDAELVVLAALLCVGEGFRLLVLSVLLRKVTSALVNPTPSAHERRLDPESVLEYKGTASQALSSATSQAGPVTDRIFLGTSPGAITAYEMSEKLFYAVFQFLNMGLVVSRIAGWSRVRSMDTSAAIAMLRRDFKILTVATVTMASLAVGALVVAGQLDLVPPEWQEGMTWALIGLVALPFSIGTFVVSRLLVIAGRQRLLILLAGIVTTVNITVDWVLFLYLGPIGVPTGTAIVRCCAFIMYLFIALRALPSIFGSDLGPRPTVISANDER